MTRTDCPCIVCKVGHAKNNQKVDVTEFIQVIDDSKNKLLCPTCYSTKKEEHTCFSKKESITQLQQNMPQKLQEQFSAKILKDKAASSGSNDTKLSTFGKPLNVCIGTTQSDQQKSFSHDDIISIKRDLNLSDNKTLKMAKHLREKS